MVHSSRPHEQSLRILGWGKEQDRRRYPRSGQPALHGNACCKGTKDSVREAAASLTAVGLPGLRSGALGQGGAPDLLLLLHPDQHPGHVHAAAGRRRRHQRAHRHEHLRGAHARPLPPAGPRTTPTGCMPATPMSSAPQGRSGRPAASRPVSSTGRVQSGGSFWVAARACGLADEQMFVAGAGPEASFQGVPCGWQGRAASGRSPLRHF